MDSICSAVLEKICSLASIGRYVIIADDEFFECFPDGAETTDEQLKRALKNLISAGFVDMKYSNGNLYCVAPVKHYTPEIVPAEPVKTESKPEKKFDFIPFWAAFAGGALGSLIISLLFAVIGYAG